MLNLRAIYLSACTFLSASVTFSGGLPEQAGAKQEAERPYYLGLLQFLREGDSVRPKTPPVHPVSTVYNREAPVPPQCYTRTEGMYNPCYVCHQDQLPGRENVMNDADLQEAYSFSDDGMTNHWKNLFEDRTKRIAKISDDEILTYISQDNYSELAPRLREARFKGWIPDLKNLPEGRDAFDAQGFAKDGSYWVAFNYKPFPSTFWPCNGSTDDVMIRLPNAFRTDKNGAFFSHIYKANLAIVEAKIKGLAEIECLPVDERVIGGDLNGDSELNIIDRITKCESFVGAAASIYPDTHIYPGGTEFLHTVRYVGVAQEGEIGVSRRMKEVRYMRKWRGYSKPFYARRYQLEAYDKEAGNLPGYQNIGDHGLDNGIGWAVQGFIEDRKGRLRVSTFEENLFCMGCHNSIGSTIDKTFSFPRKIDGAKGWGYINLKGMPDAPSKGEQRGEIATYLERAGGGDEFRNNEEMAERWFKPDGTVDHTKVAKARDVYELITPSRGRALLLNKAYKTIVEAQDYIFGRDSVIKPPQNVYTFIDNEKTPTLPENKIYKYDILLDWPKSQQN